MQKFRIFDFSKLQLYARKINVVNYFYFFKYSSLIHLVVSSKNIFLRLWEKNDKDSNTKSIIDIKRYRYVTNDRYLRSFKILSGFNRSLLISEQFCSYFCSHIGTTNNRQVIRIPSLVSFYTHFIKTYVIARVYMYIRVYTHAHTHIHTYMYFFNNNTEDLYNML